MTQMADNTQGLHDGNSAQNISGDNIVASIIAEGSAQVTVNQVTNKPISKVEEERERQEAELSLLQAAITQKYLDLNRLAATPAPVIGNPYLFLQPFGFTDPTRFFGRDNETAELLERVTHSAITFLSGNNGAGKTSLLRAGLTPSLLSQEHLPLSFSVNSEPLETSIKKVLLPNIDGMPYLKAISLTEFIRIVTSLLPDGKILVILVDDFEGFFNDLEHSEPERRNFFNEWQRCFTDAALKAHWLFCVPSNLQYLLGFFKREVQPNPNTISVPPFDRSSAQAAILKPAEARGIKVEEEVVTSILAALGGSNIDPAALQLVCYMLAGDSGSLNHEWTIEHYTAQGEVEGIMRDYLDRTIEGLEPPEREPAWQVLSVLADSPMWVSTEEQLVEKMKVYDVEKNLLQRVLIDLERYNLIQHGNTFKLTSSSLRPRIEKWKETRSARERAREEAIEQLQSIRNSALRGLLGGVIGFIAFDQVIFKGSLPDFSYVFFEINIAIAIGALAGLVFVLFVDVAVASYRGPRKGLAYAGGALGGALALALALVIYANLIYLGPETFIAVFPRATLEGGLWGLAAGLGTVWVLKSQRTYWITIPACILISGLSLIAAESILGVLSTRFPSESLLSIGLAGAVLPGCILAAAMIGRRKFY